MHVKQRDMAYLARIHGLLLLHTHVVLFQRIPGNGIEYHHMDVCNSNELFN